MTPTNRATATINEYLGRESSAGPPTDHHFLHECIRHAIVAATHEELHLRRIAEIERDNYRQQLNDVLEKSS